MSTNAGAAPAGAPSGQAPAAAPAPKSPPPTQSGGSPKPTEASPAGTGPGASPAGGAPPPGGSTSSKQQPGETPSEAVQRMIDLDKEGDARVTIVVDGKPETMTLKEAAARVGKRGAAEKRFEEAKRKAADADHRVGLVEQLERLLTQGEIEEAEIVLEKIMGSDRFERLTKERASRAARLAAMSPEDRARMEADRRTKGLDEREQKVREAEERAAKETEERETERLAAQARPKIVATFRKALEAVGAPVTRETIGSMAAAARALVAANQAADPAKIAVLVKREHDERVAAARAAVAGRFKTLKGRDLLAALESDLGPEVVAAFREAEVERLRAPHDPRAQAPAGQPRDQSGRFVPPPSSRGPTTFQEALREAKKDYSPRR